MSADVKTVHAICANHYTILADLLESSYVSDCKNRSITLRDFLLKSTAKLQRIIDMAKIFVGGNGGNEVLKIGRARYK